MNGVAGPLQDPFFQLAVVGTFKEHIFILVTDELSLNSRNQSVSSWGVPFTFNWAPSSIPWISFQLCSTFQDLFFSCLRWPLFNWVSSMSLACDTASIPEFPTPIQWFYAFLWLRIILSTRLTLKSISDFFPKVELIVRVSPLALPSTGLSCFTAPWHSFHAWLFHSNFHAVQSAAHLQI